MLSDEDKELVLQEVYALTTEAKEIAQNTDKKSIESVNSAYREVLKIFEKINFKLASLKE